MTSLIPSGCRNLCNLLLNPSPGDYVFGRVDRGTGRCQTHELNYGISSIGEQEGNLLVSIS